jgi:serine/threonine-protein kinase
MPKVSGQSLETARTILKNQKVTLEVKELEENSNSVPENYIIRSEPVAGEEIKDGDTVILYVSKGPETARMPDVLGEELSTALKMLNAAGFASVTYDEYVDSELPKDTVAEQSVKGGETVPINTVIVLKISSGPKPTEATKQVVFQLMEDMEDAYSVLITEKESGETVYDGTVAGSETSLTLELTGTGKIVYEIKINGIWFAEQEVEFPTE